MKATIKAILNRLAQFFQDGTGQLSSMRLLLIVWGIGTFVVWVILSLHAGAMMALPISLTTFLGSLIAGKVVQNFTENITTTTPTGTTTTAIGTQSAPPSS